MFFSVQDILRANIKYSIITIFIVLFSISIVACINKPDIKRYEANINMALYKNAQIGDKEEFTSDATVELLRTEDYCKNDDFIVKILDHLKVSEKNQNITQTKKNLSIEIDKKLLIIKFKYVSPDKKEVKDITNAISNLLPELYNDEIGKTNGFSFIKINEIKVKELIYENFIKKDILKASLAGFAVSIVLISLMVILNPYYEDKKRIENMTHTKTILSIYKKQSKIKKINIKREEKIKKFKEELNLAVSLSENNNILITTDVKKYNLEKILIEIEKVSNFEKINLLKIDKNQISNLDDTKNIDKLDNSKDVINLILCPKIQNKLMLRNYAKMSKNIILIAKNWKSKYKTIFEDIKLFKDEDLNVLGIIQKK